MYVYGKIDERIFTHLVANSKILYLTKAVKLFIPGKESAIKCCLDNDRVSELRILSPFPTKKVDAFKIFSLSVGEIVHPIGADVVTLRP